MITIADKTVFNLAELAWLYCRSAWFVRLSWLENRVFWLPFLTYLQTKV